MANRQLQARPMASGVNTIGLKPPRITTDEAVTGTTTERLRSKNRYHRQWLKERKEPLPYWIKHQGQFKVPEGLQPPGKHCNNMCPSRLAEHHTAYKTLLKYATGGCLVKTGQPWTKEEIHISVLRGPHQSAMSYEAITHFAAEVNSKVASWQAQVAFYDKIKDELPVKTKVLPIAAIPHKSKAFDQY